MSTIRKTYINILSGDEYALKVALAACTPECIESNTEIINNYIQEINPAKIFRIALQRFNYFNMSGFYNAWNSNLLNSQTREIFIYAERKTLYKTLYLFTDEMFLGAVKKLSESQNLYDLFSKRCRGLQAPLFYRDSTVIAQAVAFARDEEDMCRLLDVKSTDDLAVMNFITDDSVLEDLGVYADIQSYCRLYKKINKELKRREIVKNIKFKQVAAKKK
jgi:hypothetical protein